MPHIEENRTDYRMAASHQQIQDKIGYATSLCLVTGLWQVILSVLKFGKLSWLMSEIVLSAFVTAAAFHILTSQLKSLFGIIVQRSPKLFGIVYVSFHFFFNSFTFYREIYSCHKLIYLISFNYFTMM